MDNALMKKVTQYPLESSDLSEIQSPNFTENTVISSDISIFHSTPHLDFEDAEEVPNEVPEPSYDDGLRDGKAQSDLVYLNTIGVMQKALDELQGTIRSVAAEIEARHLSVVTACLKAATPSLVKAGTASEVQKLISETAGMSLSADLIFRVHPDAAEDCQRLCELNEQNIQVISDPKLDVGQIQLRWQNGGAELHSSGVLQEFTQKLDELLGVLETQNSMESE